MINETIEDLQCMGLKIVQDKDGFRFGTDAVLLADFASGCHAKTALDFCTGNGIIPILLSAKSSVKKIYGMEIQKYAAELARKSVEINNLDERIEIINGDIKKCTDFFPKRSFDMITCNPPYMKCGSAIVNDGDSKTVARHEVCCTLEDVICEAEKMLSLKGRFYMVHRPLRLAETIACMKKYKIEPKKIRFVHPDVNSEPVLFLIEGLLFGKEEVRVMPPLILKNENGEESDELKKIYNREDVMR